MGYGTIDYTSYPRGDTPHLRPLSDIHHVNQGGVPSRVNSFLSAAGPAHYSEYLAHTPTHRTGQLSTHHLLSLCPTTTQEQGQLFRYKNELHKKFGNIRVIEFLNKTQILGWGRWPSRAEH